MEFPEQPARLLRLVELSRLRGGRCRRGAAQEVVEPIQYDQGPWRRVLDRSGVDYGESAQPRTKSVGTMPSFMMRPLP